MRFDNVDLGTKNVDRVILQYRQNFLSVLSTLIEDGIVDSDNTVDEMIGKLIKEWDVFNKTGEKTG